MNTPDEILQQNAETYKEKNSDYGDSWRLAGMTLSLWLRHAGMDEVTLPADEGTWNSLGLFTRRLDKMIRSFNAEFVVDELNFESTADAHEDESTYAAMAASLLRESETVEFDNGSEIHRLAGAEPNPKRLMEAEPAQQPDDAPRDENGDPVFIDPDDIADAIDPAVTDGGYVHVPDADPEYEAAYRRLRAGGDE